LRAEPEVYGPILRAIMAARTTSASAPSPRAISRTAASHQGRIGFRTGQADFWAQLLLHGMAGSAAFAHKPCLTRFSPPLSFRVICRPRRTPAMGQRKGILVSRPGAGSVFAGCRWLPTAYICAKRSFLLAKIGGNHRTLRGFFSNAQIDACVGASGAQRANRQNCGTFLPRKAAAFGCEGSGCPG